MNSIDGKVSSKNSFYKLAPIVVESPQLQRLHTGVSSKPKSSASNIPL